jgi:chitin biosynthesis protein CHS5
MVPVSQYYLGASPPTPQRTPGAHTSSLSLSQSLKSPPVGARSQPGSATIPAGAGAGTGPAPNSAPIAGGAGNAPPPPTTAPAPETKTQSQSQSTSSQEGSGNNNGAPDGTSKESKRKSRLGSMNKEFKFPSPVTSPTEPTSNIPDASGVGAGSGAEVLGDGTPSLSQVVANSGSGSNAQSTTTTTADSSKPASTKAASPPTSIEVPAPPPVEKEKNPHRQSVSGMSALGDEEVAGMEEIDL